jgi:hypothetical protein|tara:strand:+ start:681 stop:995 length:315 start_codon:yes stop_codon:yes gene_type:complete
MIANQILNSNRASGGHHHTHLSQDLTYSNNRLDGQPNNNMGQQSQMSMGVGMKNFNTAGDKNILSHRVSYDQYGNAQSNNARNNSSGPAIGNPLTTSFQGNNQM